MKDEYKTLHNGARKELNVRGSRFIAVALPVTEKVEALQAIETVRKEFYDATHHCFAYRMGIGGSEFRSNDDGEPSGSAGRPILSAIDKLGLTDVIVVVTRYFGGTKLGVGGLVRAYGSAADCALEAGGCIARFAMGTLDIAFPHLRISNVMHVVGRTGARITGTSYDEEVHMVLEIRQSHIEALRASLVESTSGNLRVR